MFKRQHHQRIAKILLALNNQLLLQAECYFGGGTAIVLSLGEYRESVDIDFICASREGYRLLRNTIRNDSLGEILALPVEQLRDVRADRYGIRTVLKVDDQPVKLEIVSEGRIDVEPGLDPIMGVPTLSRADMYAEKLLANADRGMDRSTLSRDIIDLAMMIDAWGAIPDIAWGKVDEAYGDHARDAFQKSRNLISNPVWLKSCLSSMEMEASLLDRIQAALEIEPEEPEDPFSFDR